MCDFGLRITVKIVMSFHDDILAGKRKSGREIKVMSSRIVSLLCFVLAFG